ncbi:FAD:protein FMN transferase [candidate division CSSED10-310 bacterium]|uniref:FAD:protein FMN transferase n=1 Tax=candidate division CSSED10-310 bacterium TaxID=2855610 RepID=A0ABV6YWN5_UNCC1
MMTKARVCILLLLFWFVWGAWIGNGRCEEKELFQVIERRVIMGTSIEIQVLAPSQAVGQTALEAAMAEIQRIDALMSTYRSDSEIQAINRQAGKSPVPVSTETWSVVQKAVQMSNLTGGAFDITYKPLWTLWQQSGSLAPPVNKDIVETLKLVGSKNITFSAENRTIFLSVPGMNIDLGGIAKGYAVDCAIQILKNHGLEHAIVNAGGDLRAIGHKQDRAWTAGIRHPRSKKEIIATLPVQDEALVTSGDYERYLIINGKKYAHILDPRTGYPVQHVVSVTVIAPTALEADAFSTAIFVLGSRDGIALANTIPTIEALVIDSQGTLFRTEGLKLTIK